MKDGREAGRIVFWNADRTYGFIKPDLGGDDVFFYYEEAEDIPHGARVTFSTGPDKFKPGRLRALQVRFENGGDTTPQKPGMYAAPAYGDEA